MNLIMFLIFLIEIQIIILIGNIFEFFFAYHRFSDKLKFKYTTSTLTRHAYEWFQQEQKEHRAIST